MINIELKREITILKEFNVKRGKTSLMIKEVTTGPNGAQAWALKRFTHRVLRFHPKLGGKFAPDFDSKSAHVYRSGFFETPVKELTVQRMFITFNMETYFVVSTKKLMFKFFE